MIPKFLIVGDDFIKQDTLVLLRVALSGIIKRWHSRM
jgi:hypothetical protein